MAEATRPFRRKLLIGCLGVLGLVALALLVTATLFGTAYWRGRNEVIENRELSQSLPAAAAAEVGLEEIPLAGRVVLDFTVGEFRIEPGEPGEPIRVEAEFDTRSYELQETYDRSEKGGWTYRVTFQETSWFKDGGLRALLGGSFPLIIVTLPPDVPLALEGRFSKGEAEIELGGLWLTEIDLEFEKGALGLNVARPLVAPVERIAIRSRQGGVFVRSLGNASPRTIEIEHRMGGMFVDLGGAWVRDAEIRVSQSMGGGELRLPEGVEIRGLALDRAGPTPSRSPEIPLPILDISVSSRLGSLEIDE